MSKTILITGATDGIGLLAARKLAEAGHHILVHGRNKDRLASVSQQLDGAPSYLDRIYIAAHKHGFIINVEYVDIYGRDASTGEERYEHFVP